MPVCVLPIASCQSEAFCLFQYISDNLSLDGIQFDESGFLNGSRTVHIMSLLRYWCFEVQDSHFLVPLPNYSTFHMQVSLATLDRSLYSVGGFIAETEQRPSYPLSWKGGQFDKLRKSFHFLSVKVPLSFSFATLSNLPERKREYNISLSVLTFLCLLYIVMGKMQVASLERKPRNSTIMKNQFLLHSGHRAYLCIALKEKKSTFECWTCLSPLLLIYKRACPCCASGWGSCSALCRL